MPIAIMGKERNEYFIIAVFYVLIYPQNKTVTKKHIIKICYIVSLWQAQKQIIDWTLDQIIYSYFISIYF